MGELSHGVTQVSQNVMFRGEEPQFFVLKHANVRTILEPRDERVL